MKKILIWDARIPLQNCGGPSGYLYQIKKQLSMTPCDSIRFLSDYIPNREQALSDKHKKVVGLAKSNILFSFFRKLFSVFRQTNNPFPQYVIDGINLNDFTHIHFHLSLDYYNARHMLKNYEGIIVLTSHSPEPLSKEIVDRLFPKSTLISRLAIMSIKKAEVWAFTNADKIMFPVAEAIEPYIKDLKFKNILEKRKQDLIYCPTAILPKKLDESFIKGFRRQYNIPENAFVVSYIGRHNSIKGYDILKEMASIVFSQIDNVYFVIAGSKGPIEELKHAKWIEIGWTDKGNEIIAASDVFILPNRDTYFDLVALEVLRTGTPLIMSLTGGNKYFRKKYPNNIGFSYFDVNDINQAIDCIKQYMRIKETSGLNACIESNRLIWNADFTLPKYINNYIKIL